MSKTQDCFPEDGYLPNYWSTWPFAGTLFWSDIRVLFLPCSRPLTSNRGAPLLTPKPCSQERAAHPNVFSVWLWIVSTVPFLGGVCEGCCHQGLLLETFTTFQLSLPLQLISCFSFPSFFLKVCSQNPAFILEIMPFVPLVTVVLWHSRKKAQWTTSISSDNLLTSDFCLHTHTHTHTRTHTGGRKWGSKASFILFLFFFFYFIFLC